MGESDRCLGGAWRAGSSRKCFSCSRIRTSRRRTTAAESLHPRCWRSTLMSWPSEVISSPFQLLTCSHTRMIYFEVEQWSQPSDVLVWPPGMTLFPVPPCLCASISSPRRAVHHHRCGGAGAVDGWQPGIPPALSQDLGRGAGNAPLCARAGTE